MPNPNQNPTREPLPVLLSASVPDEVAGTPQAQRVYDYVTTIVDALFDAGVHLVFGGHPTITPLVHQAARACGAGRPTITLFQLERFRAEVPVETTDTAVFDQVRWVGDPATEIGADLVNLREPMIQLARAAIFIGGKTSGFHGGKPGVRDEFERFCARHADAPVYLVGGAGGETARLIAEVQAEGTDRERNGLQDAARQLVHDAQDPHIVAALIKQSLLELER